MVFGGELARQGGERLIRVQATGFVEVWQQEPTAVRLTPAGQIGGSDGGILNLAGGEFELGRQGAQFQLGQDVAAVEGCPPQPRPLRRGRSRQWHAQFAACGRRRPAPG